MPAVGTHFDSPGAPTAADNRPLMIERLGRSIGYPQAETMISKIGRSIGIPDETPLLRDDAIRVLDILIAREGMVGVAARFLKVRMLLVAR